MTGSKSRCQQAVLLLETLEENIFLSSASFQWLPAFMDLQQHHSNLCLHLPITLSSLLVSDLPLSTSYKDTCNCAQSPPGQSPYLKVLNSTTSPKTIFPCKVMFISFRNQDLLSLGAIILYTAVRKRGHGPPRQQRDNILSFYSFTFGSTPALPEGQYSLSKSMHPYTCWELRRGMVLNKSPFHRR